MMTMTREETMSTEHDTRTIPRSPERTLAEVRSRLKQYRDVTPEQYALYEIAHDLLSLLDDETDEMTEQDIQDRIADAQDYLTRWAPDAVAFAILDGVRGINRIDAVYPSGREEKLDVHLMDSRILAGLHVGCQSLIGDGPRGHFGTARVILLAKERPLPSGHGTLPATQSRHEVI